MIVDCFSINVPSDWEMVEDEEGYSFFNEMNGIGVIKVSSFIVENHESLDLEEEFLDFASSIAAPTLLKKLIQKKGGGFYFIERFVFEGRLWKFALKSMQEKILLVTYNCDKENAHSEEEKQVNQIISEMTFI